MSPRALFAALLAVLACAAGAQAPANLAAERSRIAAERGQADARFAADEKACYGKFAVNDCIDEARGRRRAALADLRRQEISMADAERKRKAAERLRGVEARSSPEKQEEGARQRAAAIEEQRQRQARAAEKAAARASEEARPQDEAQASGQERGGKPKTPKVKEEKARSGPDAKTAAANARSHQERVEAARARKQRLEKRLAERPATSAPLPVPQ